MVLKVKYTGKTVLITEAQDSGYAAIVKEIERDGGLTAEEIVIDVGGCKAVIHLPVSKVNQPAPAGEEEYGNGENY